MKKGGQVGHPPGGDENLCGAKLTPSERALFTSRRKQAYEALHPETKHGQNQHTRSPQIEDSSSNRFTSDTAARTGKSEKTIQRDARRGEKISHEVLAEIAGTDLDKGSVLDAIARAANPAAQGLRMKFF